MERPLRTGWPSPDSCDGLACVNKKRLSSKTADVQKSRFQVMLRPCDISLPQITVRDAPLREHRAKDHFGFSGFRAAIACLYARPEGASQAEVNKAAQGLGSSQKAISICCTKQRNGDIV